MRKISVLFLINCFLVVNLFPQSSVWEISKNGKKLYLGGSVHALRADDFPLPKAFDAAFEESSALVFETNVAQLANPEVAQQMMQQMMLPLGETLQTVLSEKTYNELQQTCDSLAFPLPNMMQFKPAMVVTVLTMVKMQQIGFTGQGVETYFYALAQEKKKELAFLESVDFQINILTHMGDGYENEFMQYSLADLNKIEESIPLLISEWRNGANEAISLALTEMKEQFPTVYKEIFVDRNNNWLPQIETYLTNDAVEFVIVGLAHMHGPDGLLEQLKNKGYQIEQLN